MENSTFRLACLVLAASVLMAGCNGPDDHPAMADDLAANGASAPDSGSGSFVARAKLVVAVTGDANRVVRVAVGSTGTAVLPVTLCASGDKLTVANLQATLLATDGGRLVSKDGTSVFANVAAANLGGQVLMGPGNYDASRLHEDPMTTLPAVTVSMPGPLDLEAGQCQDLNIVLDVASSVGPDVVGHEYSVVFCAICAGKAGVDAVDVRPATIVVER